MLRVAGSRLSPSETPRLATSSTNKGIGVSGARGVVASLLVKLCRRARFNSGHPHQQRSVVPSRQKATPLVIFLRPGELRVTGQVTCSM